MSSIAEPLALPNWRYASAKPALWRILPIAFVLHAMLLLIPARHSDKPVAPRTLELRFDAPSRSEPVPETKRPLPMPAAPPEQPAQTRPAQASTPTPLPRPQPAPPEAAPLSRQEPVITTALLLDQAQQQDIDHRAPLIRIPGVPYLPDLPHNLTQPVLPLEFNAFDDYVLSGEQEILDQWMEPGGAINAVVKLPNGDIVCGRAEPWDEMNPLYEPVAMYRSCGGGGKRSSTRRSPFSLRE